MPRKVHTCEYSNTREEKNDFKKRPQILVGKHIQQKEENEGFTLVSLDES